MKYRYLPMAILTTMLLNGMPSVSTAAPLDSLIHLYQQALKQDPDIEAQQADEEAQRAQARAYKGQLYPQINLSGGIGKLDTTRSTVGGGRSFQYTSDSKHWNLTLSQALYRPDLWAQWKKSAAQIDGLRWRTAAQQLHLFQQLSDNYLRLLLAHSLLENAQAQHALYDQLIRAAQKRYKLGQGTRTDIQQLKNEQRLLEARMEDYRRQQTQQQQLLQLYAGIDLSPESLETLSQRARHLVRKLLDTSTEALTRQMKAHHPELRALRADLNALQEEIQLQKAGHKPRLDLTLSRSMSESDSVNTLGYEYQTTQAEIRLSLPLYSGGSTTARVKEATARLRAARARLHSRTRELTIQLIQFHQQLHTAWQTWQTQQQVLDQQNTLIAAAEKRYQLGEASQTDRLNAQLEYHRTQAQLDQTTHALLQNMLGLMLLTSDNADSLLTMLHQ